MTSAATSSSVDWETVLRLIPGYGFDTRTPVDALKPVKAGPVIEIAQRDYLFANNQMLLDPAPQPNRLGILFCPVL